MSRSTRLSKVDWTDAALAAMAEAGTAGVNIEQLARTLGTTKGSFYHHFDNRQALVEAAIDRWEEIVDRDLRDSAAITDPRSRLLAGSLVGVDTNLDGFVDLALAASADETVVGDALARANRKRLAWLTQAVSDAGFDRSDAADRATRALAAYLGLYQLQRTLGETFDRAQLVNQITALVDDMLRPSGQA